MPLDVRKDLQNPYVFVNGKPRLRPGQTEFMEPPKKTEKQAEPEAEKDWGTWSEKTSE